MCATCRSRAETDGGMAQRVGDVEAVRPGLHQPGRRHRGRAHRRAEPGQPGPVGQRRPAGRPAPVAPGPPARQQPLRRVGRPRARGVVDGGGQRRDRPRPPRGRSPRGRWRRAAPARRSRRGGRSGGRSSSPRRGSGRARPSPRARRRRASSASRLGPQVGEQRRQLRHGAPPARSGDAADHSALNLRKRVTTSPGASRVGQARQPCSSTPRCCPPGSTTSRPPPATSRPAATPGCGRRRSTTTRSCRCCRPGQATERLQVGTAIAVAFARSPMTLATTAYDLQRYTRGRFVLGLGTQIKAHVERRFSMPWSPPVARMREYVGGAAGDLDRLAGRHPAALPGRALPAHADDADVRAADAHEWGAPPVYLAAVGPGDDPAGRRGRRRPARARLHHRALPARAHAARRWRRGSPAAGRDRAAGGRHAARAGRLGAGPRRSCAEAAAAVKATIAFYGSTPAYRPVLELHGWEALADELHALSVGRREDKWTAMRDLVDDEVLATFAVVAGPEDVAARGARAATTGWSTGSASTRPTPRRWTSGTRWSPPSADPRPRRGPRASGILVLGIIVSNEESRRRAPRPQPPSALAGARPSSASPACSDGGGAGAGGRVASGDPDACPGEVVDVVVSVGQWGDLVAAARRRLRDRDHDRRVRRGRPARLRAGHRRPRRLLRAPTSSCVNGAGYDHWAAGRRRDRSDPAPASCVERRPTVVGTSPRARRATRTSGTTPTPCTRWPPAVSRGARRPRRPDAAGLLRASRRPPGQAELAALHRRGRARCAPRPPGAPTPPPRPCSTGWPRPSASPT